MRLFTGIFFAACSGILALVVANVLTAGLPDIDRQVVPTALMAAVALLGFAIGATIAARAEHDPTRLPTFAAITAGVGGGIAAAIVCEALLGLYVASYGSWPGEMLDDILLVLAFPVFGALTFFLGAGVCALAGFLAGGVLRHFGSRTP
ncbi:MAG: hypothetical protein PVSMB7_24760 [Chloroflexota bacterium]